MARTKFVSKKASTDPTQKPSITTIKKATCKTLSGKSTLTYRIGIDETSTLYWQVLSNSGSGYFNAALQTADISDFKFQAI